MASFTPESRQLRSWLTSGEPHTTARNGVKSSDDTLYAYAAYVTQTDPDMHGPAAAQHIAQPRQIL